MFHEKYRALSEKIINIERENFTYSDIAEDGLSNIISDDEIIIKNKFDDIKILLHHYFKFYRKHWFTTYWYYDKLIFSIWLIVLLVLSIILTFLPYLYLELIILCFILYSLIVIIQKMFWRKQIYTRLAIFFALIYWYPLIITWFYTLIEIIKIKF